MVLVPTLQEPSNARAIKDTLEMDSFVPVCIKYCFFNDQYSAINKQQIWPLYIETSTFVKNPFPVEIFKKDISNSRI